MRKLWLAFLIVSSVSFSLPLGAVDLDKSFCGQECNEKCDEKHVAQANKTTADKSALRNCYLNCPPCRVDRPAMPVIEEPMPMIEELQ